MKLKYILLFYITVYCEGIGEDYFLDNEDQTLKDQTENPSISPSISLQKLNISEENITKSTTGIVTPVTNNLHHKKYDGDENEIHNRLSIGHRISDTEYSNINHNTQQEKENVSKEYTILDVFKDYVYHYDEPTTPVHQVLRQKAKSLTGLQTNKTLGSTNITKLTNEKLFIDLYNLEETDSKLVIHKKLNDSGAQKYQNKSMWYVPENSACWKLPVLYGELGEFKKRNVFVTIRGKLKNVIEKNEEEKLARNKYYIPVSQTLNKWCAADPCYGDHTLCLFSHEINSKLCIKDYEVLIPSMAARIGLVNTVNSMRNRVATGAADLYKHLPTAADMNQVIYDFDLQAMSQAWLHQCLPGQSACSSLEGNYVSQLECTKYNEQCCVNAYKLATGTNCKPHHECFIDAILGCIHTWFRSAGKELTATDVKYGRIRPNTFNTVQLLWAKTNKIGCAYGRRPRGDIRVVCNFAPGAPFSINTKSFCGFIKHKEMIETYSVNTKNVDFLAHLGIKMNAVKSFINFTDMEYNNDVVNYSLRFTDVDILSKVYPRRWIRQKLNNYSNGTIGLMARLVTKYIFEDDSCTECDTYKQIYVSGEPGSLCVEKGRRFYALCYDFRDPTPGYRLVAVVAPIGLFSLILYDLFSGVVRQTNY